MQIKKRSNARFLSTLLRYLSSILTIYFCLRDNLGCPLTFFNQLAGVGKAEVCNFIAGDHAG